MWFISLSQSAIAWAACLLMVGAAPTWVIAQQPTPIGAFDPSFTAFRSAIFTGLSEQIATLPPPVGGGFTYRRDPTLGVFTRKTDSFGPIFADRAETTGRGTFTLTASYTRHAFDSLDGVNLDTGEIIRAFTSTGVGPVTLVGAGLVPGVPLPVVFREKMTADVFNIGALFGVTDRLDVGMTIPFLSVKVRERIDVNMPILVDVASLEAEAAGLGDMVLRSKYNFWEWPEVWSGKLGVAASLDIRLPTGDTGQRAQFTSADLLLYQPATIERPAVGPGIGDPPLGAGIVRVRPMLIASGSWFGVSPHVNLGAELGTTQEITNDLVYAVGLEYFPFRWATFSADLLGRYAFDVKRERVTQTGVGDVASPDSHTVSASFGVKANPIGTLLVVLNVLLPLNDTGLRADVVPTVGLEWSF